MSEQRLREGGMNPSDYPEAEQEQSSGGKSKAGMFEVHEVNVAEAEWAKGTGPEDGVREVMAMHKGDWVKPCGP